MKKEDEQIVIEQVVNTQLIESRQQSPLELEQEVTFTAGEFLIHKSTFSGDFDNYDIWCVLDDGYLQKYEPVLLATGERCHQSADVVSRLSYMLLNLLWCIIKMFVIFESLKFFLLN
jgi:hypothetical protein